MSESSLHLTKLEHRAVIKFLVKKGKSAKDIFEEMSTVYGESGPSSATVKRWTRLFQQGRETLEDDSRSGRPNTAVTDENIEKVKKIVLEDRRIKLWQIAEELSISKERIGDILHNRLHMNKVSARWVPKMLTPLDEQRRVETSQEFLDLCKDKLEEICSRIVTVDETWIRQYDPESKQESMQWIEKGEKPPKKFKHDRLSNSRRNGRQTQLNQCSVDSLGVNERRQSKPASGV
ncbi:protein GVQW3-like [Anticarsia gemmatalis]|uniref:protein GVQW3-like n=1 Tax=Anticarsia gemmatalis TaxID=129554 RepID=UPI003F75D6D8